MMSHCLVSGCRNGSGSTDGSVTFHPFPAERAAAERWASLCGVSIEECSQLLEDVEHGGSGRYQLCSLHFEQGALETNPDDKIRSVKLRPGAEPMLLLNAAHTADSSPQVSTSSPAGRSQAPPSASSCSSCTCAKSVSQTSKAAQVPDCERPSSVRLPAAETRPQVTHCSTGATVVSPQPGVSQIVLNFCDQGRSVTLDNVSPESAPQGGCHCLQRVVKQVVLIFLDHPRESHTPTSSPSCQESPPTLSSSTQTGGNDGESETSAQVHPPPSSHQDAVHASTQTEPTAACTEGSGIQDPAEEMDCSSKTGETPCSPGEQICTSGEADERAVPSCPEPGQDVDPCPHNLTGGRVETNELPPVPSCPEPGQDVDPCPPNVTGGRAETNELPPVPDNPQPAPESSEKALGHRCVVPTSIVDSPAQLIEDQAPRPLRKCDLKPGDPEQPPLGPHRPQTCRLCLDPSINQYVGDLLEQYDVPSPPGVPAAVPSARCPCVSAQRCVKKIVLNFVEPQRAAGNPETPTLRTSCDLSSPVVPSRQHQETQTGDDFLPQRRKLKPKILPSPQRPLKSRSCPPVLTARAPLSVTQEEESSPVHPTDNGTKPQDIRDRLESQVTYEDVAIYFSKEEWELLVDGEKDLYREVMSDNYRSLLFLGLLQGKPDLVLRIENEEENLWVNQGSHRRIRHREDDLRFLDPGSHGVCMFAKDSAASPCAGRESVESSSHLGALMRLVNEIPGFLLGSSVTDESSSPARSTEDHGSSRPFLEVKTEELSVACSPASAHLPLSETPEMAAGLGEQRKIVTKAEKAEVAVSQSSRYSTPVSHPPVSPSCIKSDPGSSNDGVPGRLRIKQEEFPARHLVPPVKPTIAHLPKNPLYSPGARDHLTPDHARRPCSAGGTSLSRSTAASPRNPSVSPVSPSHGANCTGPGELKIKIKQEDSGSERDFAESPVYGRKAYHTAPPSATILQAEREHWRLAASPLRSPADVPLGSSPLHRLVNCLKEITAGRPRPYSSTLAAPRWGADMSRVCADASARAASSCREPAIPASQPNPFTVAVTNGAAQLRGPDGQNARAGRDESHTSNVPLSALGKCLERLPSRVSSGQNIVVSPSREDPRRAELGVKRTLSDDLSCRPGVFGGVKRPTLEASSYSRVVSSCSPGHRDLWRPPEELPRPPSEDLPIGNSHLMSVMNCVRKIPGYRPSPSIQVTSAADAARPGAQGVITEAKDVKVKQEKAENSPSEAPRQWLQPPQSPDVPKQSGSSATNVHLTGLMRLMEDIPCTDSSHSSRTMYSIAVGHSLARRMERSNYLSSCNDDSSFQAELNDSTIASADSVYSDDTSWSSENVDPSYSAIGGMQRVVSEFAELGSVSPLVAVAAPPVSSGQDGIGLKKPKEAYGASAPRLSENIRRSPRDAVGIAASACSAENGEAAFAAIRGLQKVVHGFVEQECVSPITAVRNSTTPNTGPRDCPGKKAGQDEEAPSPHRPGSSPASVSRFLCDPGRWLPEPDSSYSALSGLQKVVNGFSEMSCVSPFSAVSTPVSEGTAEISTPRRSDAQAPDFGSTTLSGQKNVINGVPDAGCLSPLTVASNVSSESDASPAMKRRCQRNDGGRNDASSTRAAGGSHCIDLTLEEEPACSRGRTATLDKERKPKTREGPPLCRPTEIPSSRPENPVGTRGRPPGGSRIPCTQLIDLTEEEETRTKPKVLSSEAARKPSHTGLALNPPPAEKHRRSSNFPKAASDKLDKPLDPGASGSNRGAVPAVNEHLSGLEKLLKGVPTFTPANRPSGQQAWSGSWWFKSTSSHET